MNPHERLHTPSDAGYHDAPTLNDDVDEVYQEEDLSPSFIVDPRKALHGGDGSGGGERRWKARPVLTGGD